METRAAYGRLFVAAALLEAGKPREAEFYMVLGDGWKTMGNAVEAAAAYRRAFDLAANEAERAFLADGWNRAFKFRETDPDQD